METITSNPNDIHYTKKIKSACRSAFERNDYFLRRRTNLNSTIIADFLSRSSIRGVPRVILSSSRGLRIMWTIAIITLITIAIFCVVYLARIFFTADTRFVVSSISENEIPFPSFTFCMSTILPSHGIQFLRSGQQSFNLTPLEYRNRIHQMLKNTQLNSVNKVFLLGFLLNSYAYSDNVPENIRPFIKYNQNDTVPNNTCNVFYHNKDGNVLRTNCQIKSIDLPSSFGCFQVSPPKNKRYITEELEFIIHLDSRDYLDCWECIPESLHTVRSGVIGKVHHPDVFPIMNFREEFHFPAGTSNIITVSFYKYKKLCLTNIPETISFKLYDRDFVQPYNPLTCIWIKMNENITQTCKCCIQGLCTPMGHFPGCLSQNLSSPSINVTFLECIKKLPLLADAFNGPYKRTILPHETQNCPALCTYIDYSPSFKSEQLIGRHAQLLMYEQFFGDHQTTMDPVMESFINIRDTGTPEAKNEVRRILQSETKFIDRLLHIKLQRWTSTTPAMLCTEVYIMNVFQFVGQVGGALSFWSGITFVFIVELIELTYKVVSKLITTKNFNTEKEVTPLEEAQLQKFDN